MAEAEALLAEAVEVADKSKCISIATYVCVRTERVSQDYLKVKSRLGQDFKPEVNRR